MKKTNRLKQRLDRLEGHLKDENPDLVDAVHALRDMDVIAHRMGLLPDGESYANKVSWWPLISVLGTFSAGKSSFINSFLGESIQKTGNQAVDDHFTVITYSRGAESQTLPGQALDSDPRFPFYRISEDLQEVIPGEGDKIDHYLQMKVVPSEVVKGKILIDSPGFDADEQRKSVLEITDHIIGLSDLVLVFFDGRHPEVGAMRDTLSHLVTPARDFKDADKFLFILNQIDSSAREDNLEEVVAAWRSALSSHGLSTGNFYVHFNDQLAVPVADERVWSRYTTKRDNDYAQILKRIRNLDVHRTYRIVGKLKPLANDIENKAVPTLRNAIHEWRKNVLASDMIAFAVIALVTLLFMNAADKYLERSDFLFWLMVLGSVGGMVIAHFSARSFFARSIANTLKEKSYGDVDRAFLKNTAGWRSIFFGNPTGYDFRARKILESVRDKSEAMIVSLNTKIANPSGKGVRKTTAAPQVRQTASAVAEIPKTPQPVSRPESKPEIKTVSASTTKTAPSPAPKTPAQDQKTAQNIWPVAGASQAPQIKRPAPTPFNKDTSLHDEKIEIIDIPGEIRSEELRPKKDKPPVEVPKSPVPSVSRKPAAEKDVTADKGVSVPPSPKADTLQSKSSTAQNSIPKKRETQQKVNEADLSSILTSGTKKAKTVSPSPSSHLPLTKPLKHQETEALGSKPASNGATKPSSGEKN